MSSDEGGTTSPALPKDSDRGSSVSSELQDEYEELLRFAVVTPKFDGQAGAQMQLLKPAAEGRFPHGKDGDKLQRLAVQEKAGPSSSRASAVSGAPSVKSQAASVRSRQTSPDSLVSVGTELFISEENINKMEDILDTWSNNLKSKVLMELQKWRLALVEKHKLELRKEREKTDAELRSLKELLRTYETSNQRKDEVILNLSKALDRQKEKLEAMRAFTQWRIQHSEAKEEAHAAKLAQQHYHLQLKRKVWLGWSSLLQRHWKDKVERACRARAEEVCVRLSAEYEGRIAEHYDAREKALAEVQKLRLERDRYEESMKKAFMRGVCALNMEALSIFQPTDGWPEPPAAHNQHDAPPPLDERGPSSLAQPQARPAVSSTHFSPLHFDPSGDPSHGEAGVMLGPSAPVTRPEAFPSTTLIHSSLPLGGTASTHRQVSRRVVTASQQKPSKMVTARITARPDLGKTGRGNLQLMGVSSLMGSVIVERHHPVTQLNTGQATAAKHPPLSALPGHGPPARGKGSTRAHSNTCHIHSIKVVD